MNIDNAHLRGRIMSLGNIDPGEFALVHSDTIAAYWQAKRDYDLALAVLQDKWGQVVREAYARGEAATPLDRDEDNTDLG